MRAFRVTVSEPDEDFATAALWEAGTCGVEVQPAPGHEVSLLVYFSAGEISLESLRQRLPFARVVPSDVPEVDWVARFRETFRPFRVGRFLVTPPWVEAGEPGDRLIVDPGRAFGTGTHETTRLCLATLEDAAAGAALGRVIDVGAGTGILGIAALRLGARLAVASDTDPEAVTSCRTHAGLNDVPLRVVRADGGRPFRGAAFDVVLANLTAPLLVERALELRTLLAAGGRLVLSGLLETDLLEVQAAFVDCGSPEARFDGEWAALLYGGGHR